MKVGVLGAGVMGAGIAQVTATAGYETVCYDVDADALARGSEHVTTGRYGFERGVERGKLTRDDADAARARLIVHRVVRRGRRTSTSSSKRCPRSSSSSSRCSATSTPPRPRARSWRRTRRGSRSAQIAEVTEAAGARGRLALGVAAGGDAPGRDRAHRRHQRRHRADDRRRRHRVREEPGGDHRRAERRVGLRRQPRLHAR